MCMGGVSGGRVDLRHLVLGTEHYCVSQVAIEE